MVPKLSIFFRTVKVYSEANYSSNKSDMEFNGLNNICLKLDIGGDLRQCKITRENYFNCC